METKRDSDFEKGKHNREKLIKSLNYFLDKEKTGLHFSRMNKRPVKMNIIEKNKNNTVGNRVKPAPHKKAMGLYYALKWKDDRQGEVGFIFLIKESGSMYLKLPKEYKDDPDGYLELLGMLNFRVMVAEAISNRVSHPISIDIVAAWPHKKSEVKGNKNRLQFYINLDEIVCNKPDSTPGLLIRDTAIDKLKELMK